MKYGWISVNDRLPKDLERVLAYYDESGEVNIGKYFKGIGRFSFESCYGKVTHWMPLPEAPIKNGKGAKNEG